MLTLHSNFNINEFKQNTLFKKPLLIKQAFEPTPSYLREFYNIIFNPVLGAYGPLMQIRHKTQNVDPAAWTHTFPDDDGFYRDISAIKKAISLKSSIIFDQYYRYSEETKELVAFIQEQFNCASGCNAYLSQQGGAAFAPHRDSHHVFIFALSGKKKWTVYNAKQDMYQAWRRIEPDLSTEDIVKSGVYFEEVMEPGDVLYIPIGQFHTVENLTDNALHLTVSMTFKPLFTILEDVLTDIYSPEQSASFSVELKNTLNELHPVYHTDATITEHDMSVAISKLGQILQEIAYKPEFLAAQNKISKNNYLKALITPTEAFIDEMLTCSQ